MKRHICISPHLRCAVCGTFCTVRAAWIYLQREAPKHGEKSCQPGKRLSLGRDLAIFLCFQLPLRIALFSLATNSGFLQGPALFCLHLPGLRVFREFLTSRFPAIPSPKALGFNDIKVDKCGSCRNFCSSPLPEKLYGILFPSFTHPGSCTLMGYPRLGIGGRKLSPQSLPELNGLEPTRNRLLKSWHMKKKRMYGKGQTQNARAISLGKWNGC